MSTIDPVISSSGGIVIRQSHLDAHSEQALIELSYIQTANDVLSGSMASLENALGVTQKVMDTLTGLQNLHNKITASGKGSLDPSVYQDTSSNATSNYQAAASGFFGSPVVPSFTAAGSQFNADIIALKAQLASQVAQLSAITPLLNGVEDPNSLLAKARAVLNDLNNIENDPAAQSAWVLDNYDALTGTTESALAGRVQERLTNAITAGQSLNDTQKQTVQQYLFLFEEYYKSASSVLQAINQMISKMAQNISR